ncbi:unnamed protein product [Arctia plantaginis]|uniref:Uncharacterized protein n=1 Tax=Arctia plantaginis TaxID=874455 RepID=A0A8S0Z7U5_ARCPL|nr:unnamed protein product [Arctia plantaginis]
MNENLFSSNLIARNIPGSNTGNEDETFDDQQMTHPTDQQTHLLYSVQTSSSSSSTLSAALQVLYLSLRTAMTPYKILIIKRFKKSAGQCFRLMMWAVIF